MNVSNCVPQELEAAPAWVIDLYQNLKPLVSYKELAEFSHMAKSSIANMCCLGLGPSGAVFVGKKRAFPRLEVVLWLWKMSLEKGS